MPLTATFSADFSQFETAIRDAQVTITTFERGVKTAAADLAKFATAFSGAQIQREALTVAAAIESIGGATKLTAAEQERATRVLETALEKYRALGQEAPDAIRKLHGELATLQTTTKNTAEAQQRLQEAADPATFTSVGNAIAGWAVGLLSVQGAIQLVSTAYRTLLDFVNASLTSFAEAEVAQTRLTSALRAQGFASAQVVDQYSDLAAAFERTTGFAGDMLTEVEATLVTVGDVMPSQMAKALQATTDLAAGLGIELPQAATLVARALQGNTQALEKQGVAIDQAAVKAKGAAAIYEAINQAVGGAAVAQLDTYTGQVNKLANAWDNFKESAGEALATFPPFEVAMRALTAALAEEDSAARKAAEGSAQFFTGFVLGSSETAKWLLLLTGYLKDYNDALKNQQKVAREAPKIPVPESWEPAFLGQVIARSNEVMDAEIKAGEARERAAKQAAEAAKRAAEQERQAIQSITDAYSGAKFEEQLARHAKAWDQVTDKSGKAVERYVDDLKKLREQMGTLPPQYEQFVQANQRAITATRDFDSATAAIIPTLVNVSAIVSQSPNDWRLWEASIVRGSDAIKLFGNNINQLSKQTSERAEPAMADFMKQPEKLPTFTQSITGLGQAFTNLAQTSGGLKGFGQSVGTVVNAVGLAGQATDMFSKGKTQALKGGFQNIASGYAQMGTAALSGISAVISATSTASKSMNILGGAAAGAQAGMIAGPWGAAAGAAVGAIVGIFRGNSTRSLMKQVGRDWGVEISEELANTIKKDAKETFEGSLEAAKIWNFGKILAEGGGLSEANVKTMTARLRDVFVMVETGMFSTGQAAKVLNENFGAFAQLTVESGKLATREFLELIELNKRFGTEAKAIQEYLEAGTGRVGKGLQAMAGPVTKRIQDWKEAVQETEAAIKEATEAGRSQAELAPLYARQGELAREHGRLVAESAAELENLGLIAVGAFNAAVQGGANYITALNQIGPGLDQLIAAQQELGITSENTALAELVHFRDRVNANQELVLAAAALNETMLALSHIGALNAETFAALEDQGLRTFDRLIAAGFTENEALRQMEDWLGTVLEAHEKLGLPIDENTQRLIDQARAAGILEDETTSMTNILKAGFDRVAVAIEAVARKLGAELPAAAEDAAYGVNDALSRIRPPTITIPIEYNIPELPRPELYGEVSYTPPAPANTVVNVNLDGATIAEVVAPQIPSVVDAYGAAY